MNQVPKPVLKSSSSKYLKKVNFKLDQVSKLDSLKQRRLQKTDELLQFLNIQQSLTSQRNIEMLQSDEEQQLQNQQKQQENNSLLKIQQERNKYQNLFQDHIIQNVSPQDDGWYKVDQQDDQMDIQIIKNDKLNQNDLEKDGWVKIQVNQNSEKLSYLDQMLPDSQENLIQSNIKSNKQINYNQQLKSTNTQDIPQEIQNKDEIIQEQFEDIQQQSQAKLNQFDIEQPIQEKLNDQNNHDKQNQLKNLQEQPLQEQNLNRQNDDLQDNQFQNQNNQNQESQLETGQQIRHKSVEFNFENESFQNHFTEKSNIADIPINEEDLYIQSENPKMYLDKALSQQAYSAADDIQFKMKKSISDFQSDTSQQNIKDIEPINDYVTNPIDTQINNNKLQSNVGTLKESQIDGISHDNYSSEQENYHNQAIQSEHIPKVQFVETKKSNIFDEMQIESNGKPLSDLGLPAQKISLFPKVEFKEIQDVQKNISIKQFQDKMKSIIENKLKQHFFSSLRIFNMLQNRCLKNKCDSKLIIFQKLVENLQKKKKSSKAEWYISLLIVIILSIINHKQYLNNCFINYLYRNLYLKTISKTFNSLRDYQKRKLQKNSVRQKLKNFKEKQYKLLLHNSFQAILKMTKSQFQWIQMVQKQFENFKIAKIFEELRYNAYIKKAERQIDLHYLSVKFQKWKNYTQNTIDARNNKALCYFYYNITQKYFGVLKHFFIKKKTYKKKQSISMQKIKLIKLKFFFSLLKRYKKQKINFDDYEDYIPIKVCIKNTQKLKDFSITETKSISIDYAKVS